MCDYYDTTENELFSSLLHHFHFYFFRLYFIDINFYFMAIFNIYLNLSKQKGVKGMNEKSKD